MLAKTLKYFSRLNTTSTLRRERLWLKYKCLGKSWINGDGQIQWLFCNVINRELICYTIKTYMTIHVVWSFHLLHILGFTLSYIIIGCRNVPFTIYNTGLCTSLFFGTIFTSDSSKWWQWAYSWPLMSNVQWKEALKGLKQHPSNAHAARICLKWFMT